MSKKIILFKKSYTRDTSLLLQQLFPIAMEEELKKAGWKNTHGIASVNYMENGTSEVWENVSFMNFFVNKLLRENKKGTKFYEKYSENQYRKCINKLRKYWEKGYTKDPKILRKVLGITKPAIFGFFVMFWTGMTDKTPKHLREKALEIRKTDSFWDSNDAFVRNSLAAINPNIQGYEVTLLIPEICNPPELGVLEERWSNFMLGGNLFQEVSTLTEFQKKHPQYKFRKDVPDDISKRTSIKGQTANGGNVKGTVRILKKVKDIKKVKEGDVIVSPMTTPDYMPAMSKAVAFITDEGGILCHAAIVSREMKKPCIIATKYATSVFRDGDLVKVEGNKGVVSKISK